MGDVGVLILLSNSLCFLFGVCVGVLVQYRRFRG